MTITKTRIALAAVLGTLSSPAFAGGDGPTRGQDCSVCDDATWPELREPMPAVVIAEDAGTRSTAVREDPTWPELRDPAASIVLSPDSAGGLADVQRDPTWPTMSSVAPALEVESHEAERRVARP